MTPVWQEWIVLGEVIKNGMPTIQLVTVRKKFQFCLRLDESIFWQSPFGIHSKKN